MSEMEKIIGNSTFICERASRRLSWPKRTDIRFSPHRLSALCVLVFLLGTPGWSQESSEEREAPMPSQEQRQQRNERPLSVNFLYGAYVPKEARIVSLTGHQRIHLFVLQTFTTPGIYVKTTFLAMVNQANGTPYEWGGGFEGFGRRAASSYARSSIQNVFSTVGNAVLQYEPRYDRCRCAGFGPRTKHAVMRNFVTYNKTETGIASSVCSVRICVWGRAAIQSLEAEWPALDRWLGGCWELKLGWACCPTRIEEFAPEIERRIKATEMMHTEKKRGRRMTDDQSAFG